MRLASPSFLVADWDEEARRLEIAYREDVGLDEPMAVETCAWLDALVAQKGHDLALLVDAANVADASWTYRQRMGAWFRANAPHLRMAVYHLRPLVRVMVLLFAKATRLPVKIASTREEALRWLAPLSAR